MSLTELDEARLDDLATLDAQDPAGMLRAVASSGAQVREAATLAAEAGLDRLADDGRPRAIVVAGVGGSGIAGDALAAVAGTACPVPVVVHRSYGLPAWVGAADLVAAVSCSGTSEETLSAADEALRRGARMIAVGRPGSPLAERAERGRALFVPVRDGRPPRASLWALAVPLIAAGSALGVTPLPSSAVEAAAARLDRLAQLCRPSCETFVNPAKALAVDLAGALPVVWGSSPLAGVAAYRFVCQLAENAKYPGLWGVLPEAHHNAVVAFDGALAGAFAGGRRALPSDPVEDLFRDRVEDPVATPRLRLVLLRDPEEHPQVARRCAASRTLAEARGVPVHEIVAEGGAPLERLASLVGLVDYASVYLAMLLGLDPTPVTAIDELKARIGT